MKPSVVILTFNSAATLPATIAQAASVSDDILIVDSFSTDETAAIAQHYGASFHQHKFENYGAQRNWAIDSLSFRYPWQLHLDADECMDDTLVRAIQSLPEDSPQSGFLIPRYVKFLGRVMLHGAMSPTWHLRLFKSGLGRCEQRLYDQHFYLVSAGTTAPLPGRMIDDIRMSISEWTARHNRWSDAEVAELTSESRESVQRKALGNAIEQKRYLRGKYNNLPLFARSFGFFLYRYFLRLGFLDGKEGLVFWVLQSFWFRFLVDAKIYELHKQQNAKSAQPVAGSVQSSQVF